MSAAAEHVVAEDERGIVGVVVPEPQVLAGDEEGVGLVGRLERLLDGRHVQVVLRDARERGVGLFQSPKSSAASFAICGLVEVADDGELAVRRAEIVAVELPRLVERRGRVARERLVERLDVAHVALRVRAHVALEDVRAPRRRGSLRCCSIAARFSCRSSSNSFSGKAGSRRISAARREDRGQVLPHRLEGQRGLARAPADAHAGLQPVELVLDLLARALRGAAHEHVGRHVRGRRLAGEALLVAEPQGDRRRRPSTPRVFFGQERQLHAARQLPSASSARRCSTGDGSNASPAATAASPL